MGDRFGLMRVEFGNPARAERAFQPRIERVRKRGVLCGNSGKPAHRRHMVVGSVRPVAGKSRRQPIECLFEGRGALQSAASTPLRE